MVDVVWDMHASLLHWNKFGVMAPPQLSRRRRGSVAPTISFVGIASFV
jgi:hypothetical protein